MRKLSHGEIKSVRKDLTNIKEFSRNPIYLLCDSIRSIFNVGAVFRASDGAFIEKIFLTGYSPYPPRKEIDKTALGSAETVPWVHNPDPVAALSEIKNRGYHIAALEHTRASISYTEAKYTFPMCLVLGNEVEGVTQELLDLCDMAVEIPMYGSKESLNVSVAGGIALYHVVGEFLRK